MKFFDRFYLDKEKDNHILQTKTKRANGGRFAE